MTRPRPKRPMLSMGILLIAPLLTGCWANTAGQIFDNAQHRVASDMGEIRAGHKIYQRGGEYYLQLPRYRLDPNPPLAYFAFRTTLDDKENTGRAKESLIFRIPSDFAEYLCGNGGSPHPAYLQPIHHSAGLEGAVVSPIRKLPEGNPIIFIIHPQQGKGDADWRVSTAELCTESPVYRKDGKAYISLPVESLKDAKCKRIADGQQWFRVNEPMAKYLLGQSASCNNAELTPCSSSLHFAETEGIPVKQGAETSIWLYKHRHPAAPLLYVAGALDTVLVDLPLSIIGNTVLLFTSGTITLAPDDDVDTRLEKADRRLFD